MKLCMLCFVIALWGAHCAKSPDAIVPEGSLIEELHDDINRPQGPLHDVFPVCDKACGELPQEHRHQCMSSCAALEPPHSEVRDLAKIAGTTDENIEQMFAWIAEKFVENQDQVPTEQAMTAYGTGTLGISQEGFQAAFQAVEQHMATLDGGDAGDGDKHTGRDVDDQYEVNPVCGGACVRLPQEHYSQCIESCSALEPPHSEVRDLAKIAGTTDENIEQMFAWIAEKFVENQGQVPTEQAMTAYGTGTLGISQEGFQAALQAVEQHMATLDGGDAGHSNEPSAEEDSPEEHSHEEAGVCDHISPSEEPCCTRVDHHDQNMCILENSGPCDNTNPETESCCLKSDKVQQARCYCLRHSPMTEPCCAYSDYTAQAACMAKSSMSKLSNSTHVQPSNSTRVSEEEPCMQLCHKAGCYSEADAGLEQCKACVKCHKEQEQMFTMQTNDLTMDMNALDYIN